MSPRAAWRLERLGFTEVYDYTAGKVDWLAAGLPTEGNGVHPPRVIGPADHDPPTCGPTDRVADAGARMRAAEWDSCVVVNDAGIVLGRLRLDRVDSASTATAEDVMESGPATVRANEDLAEVSARMRRRNVPTIIVSTPDGELLGVLRIPPGAAPRPAGEG